MEDPLGPLQHSLSGVCGSQEPMEHSFMMAAGNFKAQALLSSSLHRSLSMCSDHGIVCVRDFRQTCVFQWLIPVSHKGDAGTKEDEMVTLLLAGPNIVQLGNNSTGEKLPHYCWGWKSLPRLTHTVILQQGPL